MPNYRIPARASAELLQMRGYLQDAWSRFARGSAEGCTSTDLSTENHVARSSGNKAQRYSAWLEGDLPDQATIALFGAVPIGDSGTALETLNLGHAGLRNECWPNASGTSAGGCRGDLVSPQRAAQRLRRPPRSGAPRHILRLSQPAEERFTPDNREVLTCSGIVP